MDEKAVVRPDHKISLPLVGEVSCKGKTAEALSQDLTQKFETQTTVMVTKSYTYMDFFKDVVTVVRDAGIVYFMGSRLTEGTK
jgi:protein involved in polysaccharide export with SLBB domain